MTEHLGALYGGSKIASLLLRKGIRIKANSSVSVSRPRFLMMLLLRTIELNLRAVNAWFSSWSSIIRSVPIVFTRRGKMY